MIHFDLVQFLAVTGAVFYAFVIPIKIRDFLRWYHEKRFKGWK